MLQLVNIGSAPGDGTGDPHRNAFDRINQSLLYLNTTGVSVTASRAVTSADANRVLRVDGEVDLDLPDDMPDDVFVTVLNVGTDPVTVDADAGATLAPDAVTLSEQYAVATFYHSTGGEWVAFVSAPAAPKRRILSVPSAYTLTPDDDGVMIHLGNAATVTLPATTPHEGWEVGIITVGGAGGTVARGTATGLFHYPAGNAASHDLPGPHSVATLSLFSTEGGDSYVLAGLVSE